MQEEEKAMFAESPILKAILKLAIPTVFGQIILVLYNMADTFFIGMTGSDAKLTAAAVCMPAFVLLSAISNLFGIGGSSVISRAMGRRDMQSVKKASALAACGCFLVTLVYAFVVYRFSDFFVDLLGGKAPQVHDDAERYLLITVVIGGLATSMSTFLSHLIRSEGRALQASIGITLGGVVNIGLDPLFMFVLLPKGQEISGAAIATMLSNFLSLLYFSVVLYKNRAASALYYKPHRAMLDGRIFRDMMSAGLPACLMTLLENVSFAILDNLMSSFGIACQAGLGVAKKINMLAHSMVRGMSQGVLALIGYNYAAGNYKRMRQAILYSGAMSVALALFWMIGCLLYGDPLVSVFIEDSNVDSIRYGAQFLRILCLGGPFSACAYAIISFFQATGDGKKSFSLAILRKGILDIPMMFALNVFIPIFGIVMATPITDAVCCVVSICLFVRFTAAFKNL